MGLWDGLKTVGKFANPITGIPETLKMFKSPEDYFGGSGDLDIDRAQALTIAAVAAGALFVGGVAVSAAWNLGKDPANYLGRIKEYMET